MCIYYIRYSVHRQLTVKLYFRAAPEPPRAPVVTGQADILSAQLRELQNRCDTLNTELTQVQRERGERELGREGWDRELGRDRDSERQKREGLVGWVGFNDQTITVYDICQSVSSSRSYPDLLESTNYLPVTNWIAKEMKREWRRRRYGEVKATLIENPYIPSD